MATATSIISVDDAVKWLSASDDTDVQRCIEGAVSFVEEYVGVKLFVRSEIVVLPFCGYGLPQYPLTIVSVKDAQGADVPYTTKNTLYRTKVYAPKGTNVGLTVGYTPTDVPPVLLEACYKMLTYMYENRDVYPAALPLDIQIMVNKLRRNLV